MTDYSQMKGSLGQYFRSLPRSMQENIMQSGVVFHTEHDMRRVVNFLNDQPPSVSQ